MKKKTKKKLAKIEKNYCVQYNENGEKNCKGAGWFAGNKIICPVCKKMRY